MLFDMKYRNQSENKIESNFNVTSTRNETASLSKKLIIISRSGILNNVHVSKFNETGLHFIKFRDTTSSTVIQQKYLKWIKFKSHVYQQQFYVLEVVAQMMYF